MLGSPISKVDSVGVPSSDTERSRELYVETLVCHMAPFRDPDGNELALHKRYAPYAGGSTP